MYPSRPLKHLAAVSVSNVDKKFVEGDHPVRLVNYTDVYYGDRITPALPLMEATATTQQLEAFQLRPGDVAITKDSEIAEDIGVPAFMEASAPDMVLGYHLALLRPHRGVIDPRYLYWAMSSDFARGQLAAGATGVTRFGLRTDVIGSTLVPIPTLPTQQAISALLDGETGRVDVLLTKKRQLVALLEAHIDSEIMQIVGHSDLGGGSVVSSAPIRRLLRKNERWSSATVRWSQRFETERSLGDRLAGLRATRTPGLKVGGFSEWTLATS